MTTYQALNTGEVFTTPSRRLSEHDVRALTGLGGYTHPLFTDPDFAAASAFGRSPLPGQALLLLMGGLVERSGRFDESVIALIGLDGVRFRAPAFAGDTLDVQVRVMDKQPRPDGTRGVLVMSWECRNQEGTVLVVAEARMLVHIDMEAAT